MNENLKHILLVVLLVIALPNVMADKLDRASRLLEKGNAEKSLVMLNSFELDSADETFPVVELLKGDCYVKLNRKDTAKLIYESVFNSFEIYSQAEEQYCSYLDILKDESKHIVARDFIISLKEDWPVNNVFPYTISDRLEDINWYLENVNKPAAKLGLDSLGKQFPQELNIDLPSYGIAVFEDSLVFSSYPERIPDPSARDLELNESVRLKEQYKRQNTNLYISSVEDRGAKKRPFAVEISSRQDEGGVVFTPDRKGMYFTRHDLIKEKTNYKIYYAEMHNGKWREQGALPFCSDDFSCLHPRLTNDGTVLFFSSNNPGGFGGLDLYKVESINGIWGLPRNLGEDINTSGDEVFPFVKADSLLVFSSNGRLGFGGFDIYYTNLNDEIPEVKNLLAPINTFADQGAMMEDPFNKGNLMYFSFNQDSVKEKSDVATAYSLLYYTAEQQDSISAKRNALRLAQEPKKKQIKEEGLKGKEDESKLIPEIPLQKMIYFGFNSYELSDEAQKVLVLLGDYMRAVTQIKLELSGHASLIGTETYNMFLSAKRAREARDFLMKHTGTDQSRFVLKACGEYMPQTLERNQEEKAHNRRVEIKTLVESDANGMEINFKIPYLYTDDVIAKLADLYIAQNKYDVKICKVLQGQGIYRTAVNSNITVKLLADYNNLGRRTALKAGEFLFVTPVDGKPADYIFKVKVKDLIVLPQKMKASKVANMFSVNLQKFLEVNQVSENAVFPAFSKVILPLE